MKGGLRKEDMRNEVNMRSTRLVDFFYLLRYDSILVYGNMDVDIFIWFHPFLQPSRPHPIKSGHQWEVTTKL